MSLKFKPEDFDNLYTNPVLASCSPGSWAAPLAQKVFDKWLSEQTEIFGECIHDEIESFIWYEVPCRGITTHTAYRVNIKEITPKNCDHTPQRIELSFAGMNEPAAISICNKCGVKLKAEWKVVDE